MKRRLLLASVIAAVLHGALVPAIARGQTPPAAPPAAPKNPDATVETDPIRCWWRSSSGAIRIGENFTVTLTCAVLQTDSVQVTPDESRLDSTVAQMSP